MHDPDNVLLHEWGVQCWARPFPRCTVRKKSHVFSWPSPLEGALNKYSPILKNCISQRKEEEIQACGGGNGSGPCVLDQNDTSEALYEKLWLKKHHSTDALTHSRCVLWSSHMTFCRPLPWLWIFQFHLLGGGYRDGAEPCWLATMAVEDKPVV